MRAPHLLTAVATVVAITLIAPSAEAQRAASTAATGPRVLATYNFGTRYHGMAFPRTVVVSDSAGTLVATARLMGDSQSVPMTVNVIESDLVLEAQTPDGILTLVLDEQAKGNAPKLTEGRWSLGSAEGRLRGTR